MGWAGLGWSAGDGQHRRHEHEQHEQQYGGDGGDGGNGKTRGDRDEWAFILLQGGGDIATLIITLPSRGSGRRQRGAEEVKRGEDWGRLGRTGKDWRRLGGYASTHASTVR